MHPVIIDAKIWHAIVSCGRISKKSL